MDAYEPFSSEYTPFLFLYETDNGRSEVPILVVAPYKADSDGSLEICNLVYMLREDSGLKIVKPEFDEFTRLSTEAIRLVRTTRLLP